MILYTVQKGDSLWKIARRHNIGLDSLIAANPQLTDPNSILAGQQINVPGLWPPPAPLPCPEEGQPALPGCGQQGAERPCIYQATAGETLESIAHSFMVPLTRLVYFNLGYGKREALPQGARIVIPGPDQEPPRYPLHYGPGQSSESGPAPAGPEDCSRPWGDCRPRHRKHHG